MMRHHLVAGACMYLIWVAAASGQPVRWMNPSGGAFTDASNWEGGVVPGTAALAVFDLPGAYTVTLNVAKAVRGLDVLNGAVTLDLGGFQLQAGPSVNSVGGVEVITSELRLN